MAFSRSKRLRHTKDIETVLRRSKREESTHFSLRVHWKSKGPGRAMVVVPKKVSKKTVVRNLLKRRALEWMRTRKVAGIPADMALFVKPGANQISKGILFEELKLLFSRMKQ